MRRTLKQRTLSVLQRTHTLIEKGWTVGSLARNQKGRTVAPEDSTAVCWCLRGALLRAQLDEDLNGLAVYGMAENLLLLQIKERLGARANLSTYNDFGGTKQGDIVSLVKGAIQQLGVQ